jgi:hypothetical protein
VTADEEGEVHVLAGSRIEARELAEAQEAASSDASRVRILTTRDEVIANGLAAEVLVVNDLESDLDDGVGVATLPLQDVHDSEDVGACGNGGSQLVWGELHRDLLSVDKGSGGDKPESPSAARGDAPDRWSTDPGSSPPLLDLEATNAPVASVCSRVWLPRDPEWRNAAGEAS